MPDSLHSLLQAFLHNSDLQASLLTAVVALLLLLLIFHERLRLWRQERYIRKAIKRLGARTMENIQLPDGTGSEITIDYLLLGRDAILVVGVMRFDGLIFGSGHTDQWTQVIGRHSYKFDNPDHYLQRQINAVRLIVPGTRVDGWHLFTHGATFPRDKPDSVLQFSDIRDLPRRPKPRDIPQSLQTVWQQLLAATG